MSKIDQIDQLELGLTGNTIINPNSSFRVNKQQSQYKKWCFTFNNYTNRSKIDLEQAFRKNCSAYVFEKEIGKSLTPHLQGYITLNSKRRLTELKKLFDNTIHWEPCNNIPASINYCTKDANSNNDIFFKNIYTEKMLFFDLLDDCNNRFTDFPYYFNEALDLLIFQNKSTCESIKDLAFLLNIEEWILQRDCLFTAVDRMINSSLEQNIMDKYYHHLLFKNDLELKLKITGV